MQTIHIYITGKVQGVFFRASAKKQALALELTGWVKNTKDGKVEAMATGTAANLNEFVRWCKQGPQGAVVADVAINKSPLKTNFTTFIIEK